ncbi:HEAT repeat domain-containing protein [Calditerrivibrio sp.]|uniref:HEAT repeat domain-containing protein n=1 Tax=Calditerrivibrio sp. TaxID=2792612 RepID=UPI003D0C8E43
MDVLLDKEKKVLSIKMPQDIDVKDFKSAKEQIDKYPDISEVKLDFKDVPYLQSKLIAELIGIKKYSISKDIKLTLTNVQEGVQQILEISNLLDHFTIKRDFGSYSPHELSYLLLDPEMNEAVIEYIASNFNDNYAELLEQFFVSDDPVLIESAILIIGKSHNYGYVDRVKGCLDSPYPNVVRSAILVLGWFGEDSCKNKIYEFLKDEHIDVAEAAAATIALLSDENDSIAIKEYLSSSDERLRKIAIQALSLINDDFAYKFLVEHLKVENNETLRVQLAKAISYFNKPEVSDILLDMLKEDSLKIREAAASSLIRIKATDRVDQIMALVEDKDVWVAYFAVKAIGALCKEKRCSDQLEKIYSKVDTQVRIAIIESLGNIGQDVSEFLFQLLEDPNEDIRKEALNSISRMNKDLAIESANNALKDSSWVVRFKAIEILEELKPDGFKDTLKNHVKTETNRYVKEKIFSIVGEL